VIDLPDAPINFTPQRLTEEKNGAKQSKHFSAETTRKLRKDNNDGATSISRLHFAIRCLALEIGLQCKSSFSVYVRGHFVFLNIHHCINIQTDKDVFENESQNQRFFY